MNIKYYPLQGVIDLTLAYLILYLKNRGGSKINVLQYMLRWLTADFKETYVFICYMVMLSRLVSANCCMIVISLF